MHRVCENKNNMNLLHLTRPIIVFLWHLWFDENSKHLTTFASFTTISYDLLIYWWWQTFVDYHMFIVSVHAFFRSWFSVNVTVLTLFVWVMVCNKSRWPYCDHVETAQNSMNWQVSFRQRFMITDCAMPEHCKDVSAVDRSCRTQSVHARVFRLSFPAMNWRSDLRSFARIDLSAMTLPGRVLRSLQTCKACFLFPSAKRLSWSWSWKSSIVCWHKINTSTPQILFCNCTHAFAYFA